ncbi:MAG: hypothetical protein ACI9Y1_001089 [Lentisphaeria bacterium]|jgi:hypothetical protein
MRASSLKSLITLKNLYKNGSGGAKAKSLDLIHRSAALGYCKAQVFLGLVYGSGFGDYDIVQDKG